MATPLKSIRRHCLWCCNHQASEVRLCPAERCPLWPYRMGVMPDMPGRSTLKAIRRRCLDCAQSRKAVALCQTLSCALHSYRFGKNPNISEKTRSRRREIAFERLLKRRREKPAEERRQVA